MKKFNKFASRLLVVAIAASATGCNIYKKFEMPDQSALTHDFIEASQTAVDSTALGNLPWQQVFTEPQLVDLISRALANNTDLRNAKLNIDIAHANLRGAKASFFPSVALAPSISDSKVFMDGAKWSGLAYQIPLSVSWEVDIFGRLLNGKRSAQASYEQTQDYLQAVRSQIIGGVANLYYSISVLEGQLELQRETAATWERSVQTMKDIKEAGNTTEAAVVQSEAQYQSILASITDLETSLVELNSSMSLLVGEMPQTWSIPASRAIVLPANFNAGVPMQALANRPDIRAKERAVAVAYYATAQARSAFYPQLTINPTGGFGNNLLGYVANPGHFFVNLAAQLTAPIFSRGQNKARLDAAKLQQQQAMNNFEYSLMSASAEVRNALAAYNNALSKENYLSGQMELMTKAVDITETLFANSATNYNTTYLEVLTAQQNLLGAQMNYLNCLLARSQAVINLYQSLGGGR